MPCRRDSDAALGQPRHRALRHLAGLSQSWWRRRKRRSGVEALHGSRANTRARSPDELLLAPGRHQEVPERAEALALIAVGDGIAVAEYLVEQRALAALPGGDALAHGAVEVAEVLLHGAEVGEQGARGVADLQEALAHAAGVDERERPTPNARYFGIDLCAPPHQLGNARGGISVGAVDELAQQIEQRDEPRLRADERPMREAGQPGECMLGRRRDVEHRLVATLGVILAQPAVAVGCPVLQIGAGGARKAVLSEVATQMEQVVLQLQGELGFR